MSYRKDKLGTLDCLIYNSDVDTCGKVVVLHGYGASFEDLAPFAQITQTKKPWEWYFLNAPLSVSIGPGFTGQAWFPIDTQALEESMVQGKHRTFKELRPEGIDSAKKLVLQAITNLSREEGPLVLSGFSQGSMLSTEIALNSEVEPAGLMLLSGAYLNKSLWSGLIENKSKFPILQSHGKNDVLLSFEEAKELADDFKASGWDLNFIGFQGGHEIPPHIVQKMGQFLDRIHQGQ